MLLSFSCKVIGIARLIVSNSGTAPVRVVQLPLPLLLQSLLLLLLYSVVPGHALLLLGYSALHSEFRMLNNTYLSAAWW